MNIVRTVQEALINRVPLFALQTKSTPYVMLKSIKQNLLTGELVKYTPFLEDVYSDSLSTLIEKANRGQSNIRADQSMFDMFVMENEGFATISRKYFKAENALQAYALTDDSFDYVKALRAYTKLKEGHRKIVLAHLLLAIEAGYKKKIYSGFDDPDPSW